MKRFSAVLLALALGAAPAAAAPGARPMPEVDTLLHRTGGKNSIDKQCERNADYHKLTGLQRDAHVEKCKKTLGTFSDGKKGGGQP